MSDVLLPILFSWTGEVMEPATNYQAHLAGEQFVVGQRYRLVEEHERSEISHRHEFAWLKEAWKNFPENRATELYEQFPSPEHLRKYALIKTGHCTMEQHVCQSVAEAERLRAALKSSVEKYKLVVQREKVVTIYTAVSQSKRAMGPPMFQQSKTDILEWIANLIGVDPATLGRQTEAA